MDEVLQFLENNQLYVKRSKCAFGKQEVEYSGHIVLQQGVKVNPQMIQAIPKCPILKNINALRGFLGLTKYYRQIVKNYACLENPLTSLLKKNSFV